MAITRRQFVTRLGALAAAAGLGQADISKITQVFGYGSTLWNTTSGKPRVVWVHGAECTGCSTSVLGLFEDVGGEIHGTALTTVAALDKAVGGDGSGTTVPRTFEARGLAVDGPGIVNIQDVLVDVIQLDYHETVMSMGGDLAAQWLNDFRTSVAANQPYILVVEGAIADKAQGGAWKDIAPTSANKPWCSIGMSDLPAGEVGAFEHDFGDVVLELAGKSACKAVIAIGQCATYGGYPGCKPPIDSAYAGFDTSLAQSGATGTEQFLRVYNDAAANKVINVPGCPTNPWWFVLTVVAFLVDYEKGVTASADGPLGILTSGGAIKSTAIDYTRRLKLTYPYAIHGPFCPRYNDYSVGIFAEQPGDAGCLQKIGCKGPAVKSLCGAHGWNGQQPTNDGIPVGAGFDLYKANPVTATGNQGGHCTRAGHPCMGCTEKGYPDSFVPFVKW